MVRLTLDNIIEEVVKLVPEFKKHEDYKVFDIEDEEEKRFLLGVFGRFFMERVENYPENDPVIQHVYQFLNEQFNESMSHKDALDYLIIDIYENIASSEKGTELSRKLLKGKALEAFNATAEYF